MFEFVSGDSLKFDIFLLKLFVDIRLFVNDIDRIENCEWRCNDFVGYVSYYVFIRGGDLFDIDG